MISSADLETKTDRPFICTEGLRELVGELSAAVDVELGEEDKGTVGALCQGHY